MFSDERQYRGAAPLESVEWTIPTGLSESLSLVAPAGISNAALPAGDSQLGIPNLGNVKS